jgi:hypothetical protein
VGFETRALGGATPIARPSRPHCATFSRKAIPAACGAQMPKGMTALSAADVTIIENWINGGAAM